MKKLAASLLLASTVMTMGPIANADMWNKKTIVNLRANAVIPGLQRHGGSRIISAGTYVLKLMDSPSNRTTVLLYDESEQHLIGIVLGIHAERMNAGDDASLVFTKGCDGKMVLKTWWFAGEWSGIDFPVKRETCGPAVNPGQDPGQQNPIQEPGQGPSQNQGDQDQDQGQNQDQDLGHQDQDQNQDQNQNQNQNQNPGQN